MVNAVVLIIVLVMEVGLVMTVHNHYVHMFVCNGQCSSPDNCTCFGGWFGDNCSQPVCMKHCNLTNGYCIQPGECLCKYSWDGVYCNVSKDNNETGSVLYSSATKKETSVPTPTLLSKVTV